MQVSPGILGVSAAVLVAGVAAGAALGTVPPMQQRGFTEWLPEQPVVAQELRPTGDFPDHYPLVTRAGRFEVHELGERGLYSQARYGYRTFDATYYAAAYDEPDHDPAWARSEPEPAVEPAVAPAPQPDEHGAPLPPVGAEVAEVNARRIDVVAELAGHS